MQLSTLNLLWKLKFSYLFQTPWKVLLFCKTKKTFYLSLVCSLSLTFFGDFWWRNFWGFEAGFCEWNILQEVSWWGSFHCSILPLPSLELTSSPENGWFQFQYDRFMGELLVSGNVKSWTTSIICRPLLLMRLIFIKPSTTLLWWWPLAAPVGCA